LIEDSGLAFKTPEYQGVYFPFEGDRFKLRAQIAHHLKTALSDPSGELKVGDEKNADGPHWVSSQSKIDLSYSHTEGLALLVYSHTHSLGVDLERTDRKVSQRVQALAERFLEPSEAKTVTTREQFLETWLKKEAYAKLTRLGLARTLKTSLQNLPTQIVFKKVPVIPVGYGAFTAMEIRPTK
jgi:phosphopantetheinyl transferase